MMLIAVLSTILLMLPMTAHVTFAKATPSTFSIINPGPSSEPSAWNASSNVGGVGTANFIFYDNDTGIDSTFFVNVTVTDVTNFYGWGFGLVYDNATLQFIRAWLPSDNVFAYPIVQLGDSLVSPSPVIAPLNASYQEIQYGASYTQPTTPTPATPLWDFNGSGTLAQLEFQIIAGLNSTTPEITANFGFDSVWTAEYYWPSGSDIPHFETGAFSLLAGPPVMQAPTQSPTSVQPSVPVLVSINVTDVTGIKNVTLYYQNDTTWYALPMSYNSTALLYEATIPGFAAGTEVDYNITAFNNQNISAVMDNNTYLYTYTVLPEFPPIALPIIFAAFTLGTAVIVLSKKRSRTVPK
jgi:hypothetical protein